MKFKTIVIFDAGIGGIVATRRSSEVGGIGACDPSRSQGQTRGCPAAPDIAGKTS